MTQARRYRPRLSYRVRLFSHLSEWSLQPKWHLCSSAPGIIYAELFSGLSRSCPCTFALIVIIFVVVVIKQLLGDTFVISRIIKVEQG